MCDEINNIKDDRSNIRWCRVFDASKKAIPQYVEHLTNIEDHRLQIYESLVRSWISICESLDENIYSKKPLDETIKYLNNSVDRFQTSQTIYNQGCLLTLGMVNNLMTFYNDNVNVAVDFIRYNTDNRRS